MNKIKLIKDALASLIDRLAIKEYDEDGDLVYWESTCDEEFFYIDVAIKALEIIKNRECLFKGLSETTQGEYELLKGVLIDDC